MYLSSCMWRLRSWMMLSKVFRIARGIYHCYVIRESKFPLPISAAHPLELFYWVKVAG